MAQYFAKIKYIDDHKKEVVPICKIIEFQNSPEKAVHRFNKQMVYTIPWIHDNVEKYVGIQIADIVKINNQAELENFESKRGVFPSLHDSVIENYYDDTSSEDRDDYDESLKCTNGKIQKKDKDKDKNKANAKYLTKKTDLKTQKSILEEKMKQSFLRSKTLLIDNKCYNSDDVPLEVKATASNSDTSLMRSDNVEQLRSKIQSLQYDVEVRDIEIERYKHKLDILTERVATFRILNERQRTQIKNFELDLGTTASAEYGREKLDSSNMNFPHNMSTPKQPIPKDDIPQVSGRSPGGLSAIDVDDEDSYNIDLIPETMDISDESQEFFDKRDANFQLAKTPERYSVTKRKLNFEDSLSPSLLQVKRKSAVLEQVDSIDSGICEPNRDAISTSSQCGIPEVDLSESECATLSCNLFKKASKSKTTNMQKRASNENSETKSRDEENDQIMDESYFSNFLHKESVTNDAGHTITWIWLNKDLKILHQDWKNYLKAKDASKFTKTILRAMHTNNLGTYDEELSRRCVSTDKRAFTPNGVNLRKPLTNLEHSTINRCLSYYSQKTLKLDKESIKKLIIKKNAYITEDINASIKKIKKK